MTKKWRALLILIAITALVLTGVIIHKLIIVIPAEVRTLNINWKIDIPKGVEVLEYKDSGASFHGDGKRFTLLSKGEADISGGVLDFNFFEEGVSDEELEFMGGIYDSLSKQKCTDIDLNHELYSKMFAQNYESGFNDYFDKLLIVYDSDAELYYFFESHI